MEGREGRWKKGGREAGREKTKGRKLFPIFFVFHLLFKKKLKLILHTLRIK